MAAPNSAGLPTSLRDTKWTYRGEGNGSIVISVGNTGRVLRIVKVPAAGKSSSDGLLSATTAEITAELLHEDAKHLWRLVAFVRDTLAPLLGRKFVHPGEIVSVSGDDLKYLNAELQELRPDFRKHRILQEVDSLALCLPDFCSGQWLLERLPEAHLIGPVFAVEIKPKMGFLRGRSVSEKTGAPGPLVHQLCKYHLMQHWKLKKGLIAKVSSYCPLDLFSGCRCRVRKALEGLLQNPQNNLRVFKDGIQVFGENSNGLLDCLLQRMFPSVPREKMTNHFLHLLCDALLQNHNLDDVDVIQPLCNPWTGEHCCHGESLDANQQMHGSGDVSESRCGLHSFTQCHLAKGSILNRVLSVQRRSSLTAVQLLPVYETYASYLEALPDDRIQELLYGPCVYSEPSVVRKPEEKAFDQIKNYLLSCTACDCSLMITIGQIPSKPTYTSSWLLHDPQYPDIAYLHSIAILDTDWKSHRRIPKHAIEEGMITEHVWNKNVNELGHSCPPLM